MFNKEHTDLKVDYWLKADYSLCKNLLFMISCMHGLLYNLEFDVLLA